MAAVVEGLSNSLVQLCIPQYAMVRLRHRYLVVEVSFKNKRSNVKNLSGSSLIRAIQKSIRDLHGVHGVALSKSGLFASYLNSDTNMAFIRMRRAAHQIVSSAMPLVVAVDGEPCSLNTLYTGATIRHANIFLRLYQRRKLEAKYSSLTTELQRQEFKLQLSKVTYTPIQISK